MQIYTCIKYKYKNKYMHEMIYLHANINVYLHVYHFIAGSNEYICGVHHFIAGSKEFISGDFKAWKQSWH